MASATFAGAIWTYKGLRVPYPQFEIMIFIPNEIIIFISVFLPVFCLSCIGVGIWLYRMQYCRRKKIQPDMVEPPTPQSGKDICYHFHQPSELDIDLVPQELDVEIGFQVGYLSFHDLDVKNPDP